MATYKEIKGVTVQTVDSDPVEFVGSWASGGSLNTAREAAAGAGTQTAAIMFGGSSPAPGPYPQPYYIHDETESYDGTTFTEVADLNTARMANRGGFGTSTAGFLAGGYTYPPAGPTGIQQLCESWNGSAWSETTDFNTKRYSFASSNSSPYTSAIITGGFTGGPPPSQINDAVETWNGSSWTETTETNSPKGSGSGAGISSTAAIVVGPPDSTVESWDGSSWTEVAEMTTTRSSTGSAGTYTSGLWFGGPSSNAKTESWNGTSWTELNDLSTGRSNIGAAGGSSATTSSLAAGGSGVTAVSEEWTAPAVFNQQVEGQLYFNSTTNTFKETLSDIPGATWSSASSLNTTRWGMGSAARGTNGTNETALAFGGGTPPANTALTEEWNGSAWSEENDLNQARKDTTGFGASYTSALCGGGGYPTRYANTETWNGSSWTEVNDLNQARSNLSGTGTVTSGIIAGGSLPPSTALTETWDGTSWTETSDLNSARGNGAMSGDSGTSALLADGNDSKKVEQWDGTSWTEIAETNQERSDIFGGIGNVTLAMVAGGYSPAPVSPVTTVNVELWNGTSWTEINNLATGRASPGSQGSATSAMVQGGYTAPGSGTGTTETFTVALTNKTIGSS